jgi:hypothetical protein
VVSAKLPKVGVAVKGAENGGRTSLGSARRSATRSDEPSSTGPADAGAVPWCLSRRAWTSPSVWLLLQASSGTFAA